MLRISLALSLITLLLASCGDEDTAGAVDLPYDGDQTVILGGSNDGQVVSTPDGSDCIEVTGGCVKPQDTCGANARADVVVDADGNLVEVVCYPTDLDESQIQDTNDNFKPDDSNIVIFLDQDGAGLNLDGNIDLKGNNVVVYGSGDDKSIIDGNLKLIGQNITVRGVRVTGNLDVDGANATILLTTVQGNLHLKTSGNLVSHSAVLGNVQVDQGDNELHHNLAASDWNIKASVTCSDNTAFVDANENLTFDDGEAGDPLMCP